MKKISAPAALVNATLSPISISCNSHSSPIFTHLLNKALPQPMHVNSNHLVALHPLRLRPLCVGLRASRPWIGYESNWNTAHYTFPFFLLTLLSQEPPDLAALTSGTRSREHATAQMTLPEASFVSLTRQMLLPREDETCKLPDDVGERKLVTCTAAVARDAGGGAQCRYNDSADIVPPQLCSTPASSEAETQALNARRLNESKDRSAATF